MTSPQGHLPVHAGAEGLLAQRGTGEAQHFSVERGGFVCVIQSQQSCKAFQQGASPEVLPEHSSLVFSWHPREKLQPELAAWGFTGFPFGGAAAQRHSHPEQVEQRRQAAPREGASQRHSSVPG